MKNIFRKDCLQKLQLRVYIGLMGMILLLASCESELEEHPKSIAVETFYNTAMEVEAAVNAIYRPLRNTDIQGSYLAELAPYVDYGYARGSYGVLNEFAGLNSTNISRVEQVWGTFYLGIRNANLVIQKAPNGNNISQLDIEKYVAEAKFLRAFIYFHLVRSWGGVPIRTEENIMEMHVKRSTADEVYDLIVADLRDAEANLPDVPAKGRLSKWAAKTVLADVYLELDMYSDAANKSREVIESNKYSLVPISSTDDLQKIFGPDAGVTSEEIFYVHNSRQSGYGNVWPRYLNHPKTDFHGQGGYFGFYSDISNPVIKNWDDDDLRKGLWYPLDFGMGPTTLLNKKFIDPLARSGAGNPTTWYRYADLLLIYAEAASRANNGPTAQAMEALNQVHRRAYGMNPEVAAPGIDYELSDFNAETFLDLVIRERGYEFQYEGKRWLELKRTGKAQEIIMATKGKIIAEKNYLFPIPAEEFNFNEALDPTKDQNPGY